MKPTKLYAENFKAQQIDHELKPVTMFTGKNETGKTARPQAATVALLGYYPETGNQKGGKQPSATMAFAGGNKNEMLVHMEFDTGDFITRTFSRKSSGGDVSRVNKGAIPAVPEVMFTAKSYLSDTAANRVKMVFERIDIKDLMFTDEHLLARLNAIEALPMNLIEAARADMLGVVKKTIERREKLKQTPQAWLDELLKDLDNARKGEDESQKNASAQMQVLRPPGGKTPVDADDAAIVAALEKLDAARQAKAELDAAKNQFQQTQARRDKLTKLLEAAPLDLAQLEGKKKNLDTKIKEFASNTKELSSKLADLRKEHKTLAELVKGQKEHLTELNKELKSLETMIQCPYCRSGRKDWKAEFSKELTEKITLLGSDLALNETKLTTLEDDGRKCAADVAASETADKRIEASKAELVGLQNQIVLAQREATERAGAAGELKALQALTSPTDEQLLAATNAIVAANAPVIELNNQRALFKSHLATKDQRDATEQKLLKHQIRVEVYKQALGIVREEQNKIVGQAFETILAPARRFTDGLITGKLDYQNDELGTWSEAGWVGHDTLSGRSKTLAYLGLQVALARQSPIKLVIVDEMGIFDTETKVKVIERLIALADEGFIDAAMGTDPRTEDYRSIQSPSFQLIELVVI